MQKRNSGTVEDRTVYAKVCNQVKWKCRKAKRDYERTVAAKVKTKPKSFYKYARGKLKAPILQLVILKEEMVLWLKVIKKKQKRCR